MSLYMRQPMARGLLGTIVTEWRGEIYSIEDALAMHRGARWWASRFLVPRVVYPPR